MEPSGRVRRVTGGAKPRDGEDLSRSESELDSASIYNVQSGQAPGFDEAYHRP